MRTAIFPIRGFNTEPFFWNMKEVVDTIEDAWSATSNFKETDQAYFMGLDIPGVNKKDLDIHIEGDQVIIHATRKNAFMEDGQKLSRTVTIPEAVDRNKIQAHCENGVLYLAMPKMEKMKPQKIEVSEGVKNSPWGNFLNLSKKSEKTS